MKKRTVISYRPARSRRDRPKSASSMRPGTTRDSETPAPAPEAVGPAEPAALPALLALPAAVAVAAEAADEEASNDEASSTKILRVATASERTAHQMHEGASKSADAPSRCTML